MPHTKNNSMGYASTVLRSFTRTTLAFDEFIQIVVWPHEDPKPDSKVIPPFDVQLNTRDDITKPWQCTKEWTNINFQQLKDILELLYAIHG